MKIILFLLMFLSFTPEPDPECVSDWFLMWEVEDCAYCNASKPYGDYYLYACEVVKEYTSIKFKSQCIYGAGIEVPPVDIYPLFLPMIVDCPEGSRLENGRCVILGEPVIP